MLDDLSEPLDDDFGFWAAGLLRSSASSEPFDQGYIYINQVERSEKKVGNNKLVAAFPDDAKVGKVSGGRPVVILFDGMRADFSIVAICY